MFWLVLFIYLSVAVGAGVLTMRTLAQTMQACNKCAGPWQWCPHSGYSSNPVKPNGIVSLYHLKGAVPLGLVWPIASVPALVWWLSVRTPTPLQEKLRLEEVERRYNEDQEKLARAGHDDLDEALTAAEAEMGLRAKVDRMQRRLQQRVRG